MPQLEKKILHAAAKTQYSQINYLKKKKKKKQGKAKKKKTVFNFSFKYPDRMGEMVIFTFKGSILYS